MRKYSKPNFETDLASIIHEHDHIEFKGMANCPCCGSTGSTGDHAQAMYYSLIDDLFDLLTDDSEFRRTKAATKLITRLNEMINTGVSLGGDKSLDTKTPKVNRINHMIKELIKIRQ